MSDQIQPSGFTEDQAAEYLQLPVRTLQMWRYRKEGPTHFKLGHARPLTEDRVAVLASELVERIERHQSQKTSTPALAGEFPVRL